MGYFCQSEVVNMKSPNLFIVGAPKCGTTALSTYLNNHPNVFISVPKEPNYFSDDFPEHCHVNSMEEYMGLFKKASNEHLAVGEGSVAYLYSSVAIRNICRFNKNAKIIVMLRNPLDLVYSLHSQLVVYGYEKEKDFEKAWRLQAVRQKGQKIPKSCKEKNFLQYAQIGKLGNQIERLLNIFPEKQIKFIIFDDFKTDTKMVYDDVLSFLEVPSDNKTNFLRIHANRRHRIPWIGKIFENNPPLIRDIKKRIKKFSGIDNLWLLQIMRKINTVTEKRKPLSPEFKNEITGEFRNDVAKLSIILKRDLNCWCT